MRLRPPAGAKPGDTFPVVVDLIHWVTRELVATQETVVRIIDPADPPQIDPGAPIPPAQPGLPPRPEGKVVIPSGQPSPSSGQPSPSSGQPSPSPGFTGSGGQGRRGRLTLDRLTINNRQRLRTVRTRGLRVVTRLQPETDALRVRVFRMKGGGKRSMILQEFRALGTSARYTMRLRSGKFRRAMSVGRYELQVRPRGGGTVGRTARYLFRVIR
jgi:hypothetical protein